MTRQNLDNIIRCGGVWIGLEPATPLAIQDLEIVHEVPFRRDILRGNRERRLVHRLLDGLETRKLVYRTVMKTDAGHIGGR